MSPKRQYLELIHHQMDDTRYTSRIASFRYSSSDMDKLMKVSVNRETVKLRLRDTGTKIVEKYKHYMRYF